MGKTRYPATKATLLKKLGWKLVEVEEERQVRLSDLLKDIPSKVYESVEKVLQEMRF